MDYNYHTHTYRCKHASGTDEELIEAAVGMGLKKLGFADHCPFPEVPASSIVRMHKTELPGYTDSIKALREKYKDKIEIRLGLECEYFPDDYQWLSEQKEKYGIEYLIFGHHYWPAREEELCYQGRRMDIPRVEAYVSTAVKALETGFFTYFAHPDLFLKGWRDDDTEKLKPDFREICSLSKSLSVPLEFNLLGLIKGKTDMSGTFEDIFRKWMTEKKHFYPFPDFWEEVSRSGCKAVIGIDAHLGGALKDSSM